MSENMTTIMRKNSKILEAHRIDMIASHKLHIDLFFEEIGKRKALCHKERSYFVERLNRSASALLALL